MSEESTFTRVAEVIKRTFPGARSAVIGNETTSADVAGWDSLSYTFLIMNVESEFGIELPIDAAYRLANVGELVDLVQTLQATH